MNFEQHQNLNGLVIVITGAGSGIGQAAARAFGDAGANVLAVGRRMSALAVTAEGRPTIVPLAADVRDEASAALIVDAAVDRWGRLDVLVNNAGIFAATSVADVTFDLMTDMFSTNVGAPSLLAAAALPHLTESHGSIMNVSSTFGHTPAPGAALYGATKAAIEHLTRSWALELAPAQIRVNAVAPGPTESDALASAGLTDDVIAAVKEQEAARVPLGRRGEPEEVAAWILRLSNPNAAWVTGQVLAVDGGLHLT